MLNKIIHRRCQRQNRIFLSLQTRFSVSLRLQNKNMHFRMKKLCMCAFDTRREKEIKSFFFCLVRAFSSFICSYCFCHPNRRGSCVQPTWSVSKKKNSKTIILQISMRYKRTDCFFFFLPIHK